MRKAIERVQDVNLANLQAMMSDPNYLLVKKLNARYRTGENLAPEEMDLLQRYVPNPTRITHGGRPLDQGGEDCGSATVISSLPYSDTGTTVGYLDNYDAICPSNAPGSPDVAYSFAPAADVAVRISLCANSAYDTKLYVYQGSCPGTLVACNDDFCYTPSYDWAPHVSFLDCVQLLAGNTYYIIVDGFDGNAGNYTLDVTECVPLPIGRCCYGDPLNPSCADNMTGPGCSILGGTWTEGVLCAEDPCPIPPSCMPGSIVSRLPDILNPDDYLSEAAYPSFVADEYAVLGPVLEIRFWSVNLDWNGVPCEEDPMPFDIQFHQDSLGYPGPVVASFSPSLDRQETDAQIWGHPLYQYSFTLPAPVTLPSGWISIAGAGDPNCVFYWVVTDGAGAAWWWIYGAFWTLPRDMSLCVVTACGEPEDLTIIRGAGLANSAELHWNATQASGSYKVYGTSVKNNDGNPDHGDDPDWALLATLPAPGAPGIMTFVDSPLQLYMNYAVEHNCTPTGRCCYGDPLNPTCADAVTSDSCILLGGEWTLGETCANPCSPPPYCSAQGGTCVEHIARVRFVTIDNSSACSNYADYTGISISVSEGGANIITVTNGVVYSGDAVDIWVDWNDDFLFTGEGEYFATITSDYLTFTGTVTAPAGSQGRHRMRIRLRYFGVVDPCGQAESGFGEVEDYTVIVAPPGRCCYGSPVPHCVDNAPGECDALGGVWDDALDCTTPCPLPIGRCCYGTSCAVNHPTECDALYGVWTEGIDCATPCPPPAHCSAQGGICDEHIARVQFVTIDNLSACSNYADYAGISTNVSEGGANTITVTNGVVWSGDAVDIWVDWDNDFLFTGAGEYFSTITSDYLTFTGTVTAPAGSQGTHRMRIRLRYHGAVNACGRAGSIFGEVEDYAVIVQ